MEIALIAIIWQLVHKFVELLEEKYNKLTDFIIYNALKPPITILRDM
jgi:hypothetical protein